MCLEAKREVAALLKDTWTGQNCDFWFTKTLFFSSSGRRNKSHRLRQRNTIKSGSEIPFPQPVWHISTFHFKLKTVCYTPGRSVVVLKCIYSWSWILFFLVTLYDFNASKQKINVILQNSVTIQLVKKQKKPFTSPTYSTGLFSVSKDLYCLLFATALFFFRCACFRLEKECESIRTLLRLKNDVKSSGWRVFSK